MEYIFVYGTLKRGFRLHGAMSTARLVGTGKIPGRMFDTGYGFPAVTNEPGTVHGELYLADADTLERLDQIEGAPHMYRRERVTVELFKRLPSTRQLAWTYIWNKPTDDFPHIESGRWS